MTALSQYNEGGKSKDRFKPLVKLVSGEENSPGRSHYPERASPLDFKDAAASRFDIKSNDFGPVIPILASQKKTTGTCHQHPEINILN